MAEAGRKRRDVASEATDSTPGTQQQCRWHVAVFEIPISHPVQKTH